MKSKPTFIEKESNNIHKFNQYSNSIERRDAENISIIVKDHDNRFSEYLNNWLDNASQDEEVGAALNTMARAILSDKLKLNSNNKKPLYLGGFGLKSLPDGFGELFSFVTDLNLAGNNFISFPKELKGMSHLEKLDLSNNDIPPFPAKIKYLPALRDLVTNEGTINLKIQENSVNEGNIYSSTNSFHVRPNKYVPTDISYSSKFSLKESIKNGSSVPGVDSSSMVPEDNENIPSVSYGIKRDLFDAKKERVKDGYKFSSNISSKKSISRRIVDQKDNFDIKKLNENLRSLDINTIGGDTNYLVSEYNKILSNVSVINSDKKKSDAVSHYQENSNNKENISTPYDVRSPQGEPLRLSDLNTEEEIVSNNCKVKERSKAECLNSTGLRLNPNSVTSARSYLATHTDGKGTGKF